MLTDGLRLPLPGGVNPNGESGLFLLQATRQEAGPKWTGKCRSIASQRS